jgi:gluconokinase
MEIPGLRSPYVTTGGIVYFARMLDKIRLQEAGALPKDYIPNLGAGFDGCCLGFLWIEYPALVEFVKGGASDEQALEWCFTQGRKPSEQEIKVWNSFMRKAGWRDELSARLTQRLKEGDFEERTDIQTFFDYIDLDEDRDPAFQHSEG